MTVARILSKKGRKVFSIAPERSLQDAAQEMARCGVGALVAISEDGRVVGIISERDIVRAAAKSGELALKDTIARHMTTGVKFALEDETIDSAMEAMTQGRFRHMPVMRRDMLVGIVSIGDVVKERIDRIEHEHRELRDYIASA
jgi:CBS domain-containing protein